MARKRVISAARSGGRTPSLATDARKTPAKARAIELMRGQLWKTGEAYLRIMEVGRMLVHLPAGRLARDQGLAGAN